MWFDNNETQQGALGNIKKPDFPEQMFYSECVAASEEGMAPSAGPCPVESQKNLDAANASTDAKLDKIKEHADANGNGQNETGFNAMEEIAEMCVFNAVTDHLSRNSRIYATSGATVIGAGLGHVLARRSAKKKGLQPGTAAYRKHVAKKMALGAAAGLAAGEGAHLITAAVNRHKANKMIDSSMDALGVPKDHELRKAGHDSLNSKLDFGAAMASRKFGKFNK